MDRDEWLARRTFRGADYDPERVADGLRRQGLTVSVCLPTLEVAGTVGPIVERVRTELVERVPLVAEIVAIDSRSGDGTREAAAAAGATVVQDHEILPDLPPARGKGEALWKSLAVVRGDIVGVARLGRRGLRPGVRHRARRAAGRRPGGGLRQGPLPARAGRRR